MSESNCGCALALPSTCIWPGGKNVVDIFTGFVCGLEGWPGWKILKRKYPPTPLPARGRRWGSVRLALERDCGSLLPSLSPSPVQSCTLPAFFLSLCSCSSSFLFFPFPFCCRRTGQTSAAWKSSGSEAFVAGRSLWTDSLTAYLTQTRR